MYKGYISTRFYKYNKADNCLDWGTDDVDERLICECNTIEECIKGIYKETEGSKWFFYPSAYVTDSDGGEVWENTLEYDKCDCCGHESHTYIETEV